MAILLKVYAKCIHGQDHIARRRIEDALGEPEESDPEPSPQSVFRVLSGCKTDIKGVIAKRADRSEGQTSPTAASGVAYVGRP